MCILALEISSWKEVHPLSTRIRHRHKQASHTPMHIRENLFGKAYLGRVSQDNACVSRVIALELRQCQSCKSNL